MYSWTSKWVCYIFLIMILWSSGNQGKQLYFHPFLCQYQRYNDTRFDFFKLLFIKWCRYTNGLPFTQLLEQFWTGSFNNPMFLFYLMAHAIRYFGGVGLEIRRHWVSSNDTKSLPAHTKKAKAKRFYCCSISQSHNEAFNREQTF